MVILLGALTLHGLIPGPQLVTESPEMLHAAIAGLAAGSIILIITGWKMASWMLKIIMLDRSVVIAVAIAIVLLGVYAVSGRLLDVWICIIFGVIGYVMLRYGYSTAAAALAVVLASGLERTLRQSLNIFHNDLFIFFKRPISATILAVAIGFLIFGTYRTARARRRMYDEVPMAPE